MMRFREMRICSRCAIPYERRFYSQHRRTEHHLDFVSKRTEAYGGPSRICPICGDNYAYGTYSVHVESDDHMIATKRGTHHLRRRDGGDVLDRRDEYIAAKIEEGWSYGQLAEALGVSRQRVHQICKKMGVKSNGGPRYHGTPQPCFYDGMHYSDWNRHVTSTEHVKSIHEFQMRVDGVRRSVSV